MARNLIWALIIGFVMSGSAVAQRPPLEIRETVTAANVSVVMDRLERAARTRQTVSLHLIFSGRWTDDYRFQYYPRFEHLEVSDGGRILMVDEGVTFVNDQNVVSGLFRIDDRGGYLEAVAVSPDPAAIAESVGTPVGRSLSGPAAPVLQVANNDRTMVIDEGVRGAVAAWLGSNGVDADYDGTAVRMARGARATQFDLGEGQRDGYAYCALVTAVLSNGQELGTFAFLLFGEIVDLVRDPGPRRDVWKPQWSAFSINDAPAPVRERAIVECQQPAD